MTHIDLGIDEATFIAALRVIGHPWQVGQRCVDGFHGCGHGDEPCEHGYCETHDIPIPTVTDPLVMQMLREIVKRIPFFVESYRDGIFYEANYLRSTVPTLEAAIIRATAALDKEG